MSIALTCLTLRNFHEVSRAAGPYDTYKKQGHIRQAKSSSLCSTLSTFRRSPSAKGRTHPRAIIGVAACDSAKKASRE